MKKRWYKYSWVASHNGSKTLIRSLNFNECYWLKKTTFELRASRRKDICSSQIRMVAEDEVATAKEGDSVHLTKGTQTFGKKMEAIEEPSEEG